MIIELIFDMSKDEAVNRINNTNLSKKVGHCKNMKSFFLSMYKRWIIKDEYITKEIKKDCK